MDVLLSRSLLSNYFKNHINMKIIIKTESTRERLTIVCEDELNKDNILVRGHFRMAGGRKVYVKTHYRKR